MRQYQYLVLIKYKISHLALLITISLITGKLFHKINTLQLKPV